MSEPVILSERIGSTGKITINRPSALNALNEECYRLLNSILDSMEADPEVRVIVITGAGEKSFCAGGDIKEEITQTGMRAYNWFKLGHKLYEKMEDCPKPIIAAINGYCLGGGLELALACDMRICSENAKLGAPEVNLGVTCGFGGNLRLPRIVGKGAAKKLLMTGKIIDAQEAYRIGLADDIFPKDRFEQEISDLCATLASKSALTLDIIKKEVDRGTEMSFSDAARFECAVSSFIFNTEDMQEGMSAFIEKRKPNFKDR